MTINVTNVQMFVGKQSIELEDWIGIHWNSLDVDWMLIIGIHWNSLDVDWMLIIGIHWNSLDVDWNSLEFIGIDWN